jgi:hypothetical protein
VSGRHIRIYYFDATGQPMECGTLCSAVMPKFRMPVSRLPAQRYTPPSYVRCRRELAAAIVLKQRNRSKLLFHAVLIVACPDRASAAYRSARYMRPHPVPTNSYLGSFAALAPAGQLVAGDVTTLTLPRARNEAMGMIQNVLRRPAVPAPATDVTAVRPA